MCLGPKSILSSNLLCRVRWSMVDRARPFASPGSSLCRLHGNSLNMVEIPPNGNRHLFKLSSAALGGVGNERCVSSDQPLNTDDLNGEKRS